MNPVCAIRPAPISGAATVSLTRDIAAVIHDVWKGRDLQKSLDRAGCRAKRRSLSRRQPNETLAERHQRIIARIDSLKQQWREQVGGSGVLENSALTGRKFNRGNQGKWMEKVNARRRKRRWLPAARRAGEVAVVSRAHKAGGEPPVHPVCAQSRCWPPR